MTSLPYFNSLNRKNLVAFINSIVKQRFIKNQMVFKEGQLANRVFVVLKGEFELKKQLPKKMPSKQHFTQELFNG